MSKPRTQTPSTGAAGAQPMDGLPTPRRYWAMLSIWLALSMAVLDGAIANVALPTISRDLDASAAASIWVVNAFQLAVTVTLLPFAALGDRLGYRRVYIGGLIVFTMGSLACALSHTLPQLTAARVLQGLGAGAVMSLNAALVRFTLPKRMLGRGIGANAAVISIASAAGPTIAAAVLARASWEWLFAISVPVGVLAIVVGLRALPRTEGSDRRFDVVSAILNAVAFGFLILGAESLAREGVWDGLWKLAVGAVAAVILVRRALADPAPLVPVDLLRIPIFGLSIVTSIATFASQMMAFVALPFHLQAVLGRSVVETGLLMTPWPLAIAVSAPLAGRLADRYASGLLGGIGLAVFSAGLFLVATVDPAASNPDIAWRMVVCGLGFGFFQSPNNRTLVSSAPVHRSGAAGGMLSTARLLGQTAGAVVTAVFFHMAGPSAAAAALATAAVIALAAAGISLSRIRVERAKAAPPSPEEVAETTGF